MSFMGQGLESSADVRTEGMGFHTTHWSIVLIARDRDGTAMRNALASLCGTYWYPLYAFVRRRGAGPEEAEDLTQGFFYHFLERKALAKVRPEAGKFRSFLLVCLKNYLSNERDRAQAQRRGGGCVLLPLDGGDAETRYSLEPSDSLTPDALYERRWAFAVLEQALNQLRHDYGNGEKRQQLEELEGFLPCGGASVTREELAARRGVSVGAIDVAIHRLRQRFGTILREQIAQTVSSEAEVDEELRYLISVFGS